MKCEKKHMNMRNQHNCCCGSTINRRFLSKEEKIKQLKHYKNELEKEITGVESFIKQMEKE